MVEGAAWLNELPEGGVRRLFQHLADHGMVTEQDAAAMLGGARGVRRFSLALDEHARKAPWPVRVEVVAGVKRFVR